MFFFLYTLTSHSPTSPPTPYKIRYISSHLISYRNFIYSLNQKEEHHNHKTPSDYCKPSKSSNVVGLCTSLICTLKSSETYGHKRSAHLKVIDCLLHWSATSSLSHRSICTLKSHDHHHRSSTPLICTSSLSHMSISGKTPHIRNRTSAFASVIVTCTPRTETFFISSHLVVNVVFIYYSVVEFVVNYFDGSFL